VLKVKSAGDFTRLSLLNFRYLRASNLALNLSGMLSKGGTELLRVVEGLLLVLTDVLASVKYLLLLTLSVVAISYSINALAGGVINKVY
jgi:hypothetical protein